MDNNNNNQDLRRKIASLESQLDQIESQFSHLNDLLLKCGFPEGVLSLEKTIEDMLLTGDIDSEQNEEHWKL